MWSKRSTAELTYNSVSGDAIPTPARRLERDLPSIADQGTELESCTCSDGRGRAGRPAPPSTR